MCRAESFEELHSQYLSLRNTDVEIFRAAEWEGLARRLVRLADENPTEKGAPLSLFDASILYEKMFLRLGGKDRLDHSVKLLERLARDYPGHELVDDGLVRRGELELYELDDPKAARRSFLEVVEAYGGTDMLEVAKARIRSIDSGTYRRKESEPQAGPAADSPAKPGRMLIVIDPGHGGEDFGAVGIGGLLEKDVVLDIALRLERELTEKLGAVVRLTRRADRFVPLADRTNLANDFEADLFLSLHTNASPQSNVSGMESYYLDNTNELSSKKLAERENQSLQFEAQATDLQFILSDLIQNAKLEDSILLANMVQSAVARAVHVEHPKLATLGVKKAPFYVLVGAHMPCILIELFFIDHTLDGVLLGKKDFRATLARGLFIGVKDYLERRS